MEDVSGVFFSPIEIMKHSPTLSLLVCLGINVTHAEVIPIGSGSYSAQRPAGCEPLPDEIFVTDSFKGAVPTNQWWSSLVWEKYSQNMFPHPLAMVCHEGGLAVTYPGPWITGRGGHIMGGGVSKTGDFVIGHSEMEEFPSARLAKYSEWFITSEFKKVGASLSLTFGHGSPFVFGKITGGNPRITFTDQPMVWATKENVLGVTVRGNHYGFFGSKGSQWSDLEGKDFTNSGSKGYFSVALLPDRESATLEVFLRCAHNHVLDTQVSSKTSQGQLETVYEFTTKAECLRERRSEILCRLQLWKVRS